MTDVTETVTDEAPPEWVVVWNGTEYRPDPTDFSGIELGLIKQRTGLNYRGLISGIANLDDEAIRAVFWLVDRRTNPSLNFSDYAGPAVRVLLPSMKVFNAALEAVGKAMGMDDDEETTETSGSGSSPSTPAGTESSRTE